MRSYEFPLAQDQQGSNQLDQQQGEAHLLFPHAPELHVSIGSDTSYKIGTCSHCVLMERGRPERAWDADGDNDLDFDRDQYFALLSTLGLVMSDRQAYVCP